MAQTRTADNSQINNNYAPPVPETIRDEFHNVIKYSDEFESKKWNLQSLNETLNQRIQTILYQFGGGGCGLNKNEQIKIISEHLKFDDLKLMRNITELSAELMDCAKKLRIHSSNAQQITLNKMKHQLHKKRQDLIQETSERNKIMNSRDIWSSLERTDYIREGCKAAIKTNVNDKLKERYIVTKIISINKKYKTAKLIDDADDKLNNNNKYDVKWCDIIPLPSLQTVPIAKRKLFNCNEKVLAIYPGTTCFYVAKILKQPKTNKYYLVQFDDDNGDNKNIGAENIMPNFK